MKYLRIVLSSVMVLAALLMAFSPAKAAVGDTHTVTFSYSCTRDDQILPYDWVESIGQFSVDVIELSSGQVGFTFYNTGNFQSSITDIYFQDGSLLGIADVIDGPGVSFSQGANPGDLPGGNNCIPPFEVHEGFLADSDAGQGGVKEHGVNNFAENSLDPEEWVEIVFNLQPGMSWSDVVTQLESGDLRIGIHVQGYASGGSESFVTDGGTAIKLDKFTASASRGKVALNWATGTEIDNAGFNLYRAASVDGQRVQVNNAMISAQAGAASGAIYQAADTPGYGTFYYWLEDVSTGGAATLHGPVKVTLAPAFRAPVYRPVLPGN